MQKEQKSLPAFLPTSIDEKRALRVQVPRWHFPMINDEQRNHDYAKALRQAITPDTHVIDIGAGTGLLSMIAAHNHAAHVVACEAVPVIAAAATEIVTYNRLAGRIQIIPKSSLDLVIGTDLPRKADLIVTEIFDCGLLGEEALPTIRHARQHLLRKGGHMIPQAARVYAALFESEQVHRLNHAETAYGFDVTAFNRLATHGYFPVRLNTWCHRLLTQPQEIFRFDFLHDSLQPAERPVNFAISNTGRCHGVVFWFELDLNDHIHISNSPDNLSTHWMQAVQCFPSPLDVAEAEVVEAKAMHNDTSIWFTSISR